MGPSGLEPLTSRLSAVCSNQLSYRPQYDYFADKNTREGNCPPSWEAVQLSGRLCGCLEENNHKISLAYKAVKQNQSSNIKAAMHMEN